MASDKGFECAQTGCPYSGGPVRRTKTHSFLALSSALAGCIGFVAWHLIQFTHEALGGQQNASF